MCHPPRARCPLSESAAWVFPVDIYYFLAALQCTCQAVSTAGAAGTAGTANTAGSGAGAQTQGAHEELTAALHGATVVAMRVAQAMLGRAPGEVSTPSLGGTAFTAGKAGTASAAGPESMLAQNAALGAGGAALALLTHLPAMSEGQLQVSA